MFRNTLQRRRCAAPASPLPGPTGLQRAGRLRWRVLPVPGRGTGRAGPRCPSIAAWRRHDQPAGRLLSSGPRCRAVRLRRNSPTPPPSGLAAAVAGRVAPSSRSAAGPGRADGRRGLPGLGRRRLRPQTAAAQASPAASPRCAATPPPGSPRTRGLGLPAVRRRPRGAPALSLFYREREGEGGLREVWPRPRSPHRSPGRGRPDNGPGPAVRAVPVAPGRAGRS